jgi:hypothetical protein
VDKCKPLGIGLFVRALADLLRTRRFYFDTPDTFESTRRFDPRMLVFEYTQSIILRERQVGLVRDFTAAADSGGAECAQMLMGEVGPAGICRHYFWQNQHNWA